MLRSIQSFLLHLVTTRIYPAQRLYHTCHTRPPCEGAGLEAGECSNILQTAVPDTCTLGDTECETLDWIKLQKI